MWGRALGRTMKRLSIFLLTLFVAGCLGGASPKPTSGSEDMVTGVQHLEAQGAQIIDEGVNRTFRWAGALGAGAQPPLAGAAPGSDQDSFVVPVDGSVATVTLTLDATAPAVAELRTNASELACGTRAGRVCTVPVPNDEPAEWHLTVTSLAPEGTSYEVRITLHPSAPVYATDPYAKGAYTIHEPDHGGGEPTLAVLKDGRVLVVAGSDVLRLNTDGTWDDVTPPADATASATLDPFLVGDRVTDRVYNTQLVQCLRLSWTDDAGATWQTNPAACGGPEQHHQKLAVGPGPAGRRIVQMGTMNLASWLTTDETVIMSSRSLDGGYSWSQNPAMVREVHGMEPRAVGNIAVADDGSVHMIAYLCDAFVDAEYNGLAVGRSTDYGATWTWQRIGPGGGPCEGIDPGLSTAGNSVHAVWWDSSAGAAHVWYSMSKDSGVTWSPPSAIPTPGLLSFELVDAAASKDRVAAAFLANIDSDKGPNQVDGWSRWYPYVATLDLTSEGASWEVVRLEDHPLQLGPICIDGPKCMDGSRNLLDFIDVQLGPEDRVHVAYPDGCNANCTYLWDSRRADLRVAIED
jgi:hypothetical protein